MLGSRDKGWKALQGDITTFCKILQFAPTHRQLHYLLRVQRAGRGSLRLGLPQMEGDEAFAVTATALLYRAFAFNIPSYLFYEHDWHARKWVQSMALWGANSIDPMRAQLQVSKQRRFLMANGVHVCHGVGPWMKDDKFTAGRQDIILPDFDNTPTHRVIRACELTVGSILYVPHNGTLAESAHRRKAKDRRGGDRSS